MTLTKQLNFDAEIVEIISAMTWEERGNKIVGRLPDKQLAREMYLQVNKVLTNHGGVWNRSTKGFIFDYDPRPALSDFIGSGVLVIEKDGFFKTPKPVVDTMLQFAPYAGGLILEPEAGTGDLAVNTGIPAENFVCVEKNFERCRKMELLGFSKIVCADFLTLSPADLLNAGQEFKNIYMNPPFEVGQDVDHVVHALRFLPCSGVLCSVMSVSVLTKQDKRTKDFWKTIHNFNYEVKALPPKSFRESGTDVNTILLRVMI